MTDSLEAEFIGIHVTTENDVDPLLDHLGEYRSEPGPEEHTIDRQARGHQGRGQYRYFVSAYGPEETGAPDIVEESYERMESYGTEWVSIGIRAVAEIKVGMTHQTIESGGVWGVESDGPKDYLDEIACQEVDELLDILDALGIEVPDGTEPEWGTDAPVSGTIDRPQPNQA